MLILMIKTENYKTCHDNLETINKTPIDNKCGRDWIYNSYMKTNNNFITINLDKILYTHLHKGIDLAI